MSYRPKYNDSDNNKVDLPIDAETLAGHAVESSGVDSNTSTLPTTAQVKTYVDYLINILNNKTQGISYYDSDSETEISGNLNVRDTLYCADAYIGEDNVLNLLNAKVNKSDIGYVEIGDTSGTLTADQILEAAKKYCIVRYADGNTDILFYKTSTYPIHGDEETESMFNEIPSVSLNATTYIYFKQLKCNLTTGAYVVSESTFITYNKAQLDTLLNAKANASDIPHLYEHNIVLADNADITQAENYVTFTLLSSSDEEFNTESKIIARLIGDDITSIRRAKKASGRCNTDSFMYVRDVNWSEQSTDSNYCESSVVGIYALDDDPSKLKIVLSNLDEVVSNYVKSADAPITCIYDTVVPIY